MTPLLGTNISSTPVGDVPAGDNKTARAKAAKVFTRHETRPLPGARRKPARIPRFSRNTNHESRLFFESRILPPPGPSHPPPSHSFPVHDGSPLFTIVRHCSSKNIALGQCHLSVRTGNTACLVFMKHETRDTNHGLCCGAAWAAMARHGRHIAPRQRACPVGRSRSASRRAPLAGLLPVPRTPNEPMPGKGNVLHCVDSQKPFD